MRPFANKLPSFLVGVIAAEALLCWLIFRDESGLLYSWLSSREYSAAAGIAFSGFCGALAGYATNRWYPRRFSLRAMLIAMTLVAVVLGLVCCTVR
jgi:hypothetical protein